MTTRHGFRSLADVVKDFARGQWGEQGAVALDLIAHWGEIVGDDKKDKIIFKGLYFPPKKRKEGVLVVSVSSGLAAIVRFDEKNILARANQFFGFSALTKLKIEQHLS